MIKTKVKPGISRKKIAELSALAKTIDADEQDEIVAMGRKGFARRDAIRATIARLKAARLAKQMTLDDVAAVTGIGKPNLSRLENDRVPNPTIDTLLRISDAVGCKLLA